MSGRKKGSKIGFFLKILKKGGLKSIFFAGTLKKGGLKSRFFSSALKKGGLYRGAYPSPSHNEYPPRDCSNSNAKALKLLQSCAKPSIWWAARQNPNASAPCQGLYCAPCQGLYSLRRKTYYSQILWNLEGARLEVIMIISIVNLTGTSAALLPRCLSNLRAIGKV